VDCISEINPDDILEGSYGCYDDYIVELDETLPYGNGPWVPGVVGAGDVGKTYQVRVTHLVTATNAGATSKLKINWSRRSLAATSPCSARSPTTNQTI